MKRKGNKRKSERKLARTLAEIAVALNTLAAAVSKPCGNTSGRDQASLALDSESPSPLRQAARPRNPNGPLISAEEIAEICQVPKRTVSEKWCYRPDFPNAYRPGLRKMWDRKEILGWLEKQRIRK